MTVSELIKKLQAIEPTCGEFHVFCEDGDYWEQVEGVALREANLGGDWAGYVALMGYDPGALPASPASIS